MKNKIYAIVKGRETFYRRHTDPITSCSEVKYVLKKVKAVVLPTLLYACETWTVYRHHARKLNHFHLRFPRKILKIRRQDKISDTEVLKKSKMQSVHTLLKLAQLRWTGHATRMPDERLPKKVLYGELQE